MRLRIEFLNLSPNGAPNVTAGPFGWVTLTYNALRAGEVDEDGEDLASFDGKFWIYEGEAYSDVNLDPVE